MAIRLDIRDYCSDCCDFDPDVIKPRREEVTSYSFDSIAGKVEIHRTDTIVKCKHANRCEAIKRYLSSRVKGDT